MARRNSAEGDSLDLLLDTICNTFGGVLFLAMLVCLLSTHGSPRPQRPVDAEMLAAARLTVLDAEEKHDAAQARADAASRDVASRADALGWSAQDVRSLAETLGDKADALDRAIHTGQIVDALESETRTLDRRAVDAERQRDQARDAAAGAQRDAQAKQRANRVTLRVPNARTTSKRQAVAYVCNGRVYVGVYPTDAYRFAPLYRGVSNGPRDQMGPNDLPAALGSGVITSAADAEAALAAQGLPRLDADAEYIMFAVWPDSYDAFRLLRDVTIRAGADYGLLLMEAGTPVTFGGGQGYVQ